MALGAINGRGAKLARHYPELVNFDPLPFGEQELFQQALDALLARRDEPLAESEYQLAYAAGREMWRASREHGLAVFGREIHQEMAR